MVAAGRGLVGSLGTGDWLSATGAIWQRWLGEMTGRDGSVVGFWPAGQHNLRLPALAVSS